MFLDNKRLTVIPGTYEAWLWRRWQFWTTECREWLCTSFVQPPVC